MSSHSHQFHNPTPVIYKSVEISIKLHGAFFFLNMSPTPPLTKELQLISLTEIQT